MKRPLCNACIDPQSASIARSLRCLHIFRAEKAAEYDAKTAVKLKEVDPVALNEVLAIIEPITRKPAEQ